MPARIVTEASLKGTELYPWNTKVEDVASSMNDPQCEQEYGKPQAVGTRKATRSLFPEISLMGI